MRSKKGFTLIEMLVVIAVVAILVAIIVPVAGQSVKRAKAATDAANMRIILGKANAEIYSSDLENALSSVNNTQVTCASFDGAKMYIVYADPGFVEVMYVIGDPGSGSAFYSLKYFSDVASTGSSSEPTGKPEFPTDVTWYNVTDGAGNN